MIDFKYFLKKYWLPSFFFVISSLLSFAESLSDNESFVANRNPLLDVQIEAGYSAGKFIGIEENYGEFGLFLPFVYQNQFAFFIDGKGYWLESNRWGSSVGGGIRFLGCDGRIWGANIYYDYLEFKDFGTPDRIGVGLEWLGSCWDFRINGYFPLRHKFIRSESGVTSRVALRFTAEQEVFAISKGFDAELGAPLWCWRDLDLYGAAGFYYFTDDADNDANHIWGEYASLELSLCDFLFLRVRTSYDRFYHSHTQGTVLLNIPFDLLFCCKRCIDCCRELFIQPVRRNGIIFTNPDNKCCQYNFCP